MRIKTINKKIVSTEKLSKNKKILVETIEKSNIVQKLAKINGFCYVFGYLPDEEGYIWITQNLMHPKALSELLRCLNDMVSACTKGQGKLVIVPTYC